MHFYFRLLCFPSQGAGKLMKRIIAASLTALLLLLAPIHANPPASQAPMLVGGSCIPSTTSQVILTNGTTTWSVPTCWHTITAECVSAGGNGNNQSTATQRSSGGGGSYAKSTIPVTAGATLNVGIGAGPAGVTSAGATSNGGDTWFNATSLANAISNGASLSCGAQGAQAGTTTTAGQGGLSSASVGSVKASGGNGDHGLSFGGGGGAGGPNGAGSNGVGSNTTGASGGNADGGTVSGPTVSAIGNSGTEFDGSHGLGTGGVRTTAVSGFAGGLYGGGGSHGNSTGTSGPGANGLLVINYVN